MRSGVGAECNRQTPYRPRGPFGRSVVLPAHTSGTWALCLHLLRLHHQPVDNPSTVPVYSGCRRSPNGQLRCRRIRPRFGACPAKPRPAKPRPAKTRMSRRAGIGRLLFSGRQQLCAVRPVFEDFDRFFQLIIPLFVITFRRIVD